MKSNKYEMEIYLNGYKYIIKEVSSDDYNLCIHSIHEHHFGMTKYKTNEIFIMNDLNEVTKRKTLMHELTHAFIDAYGFLQVDFNDEIVADFIGSFADDIVAITNDFLSENNEQDLHEMLKKNFNK